MSASRVIALVIGGLLLLPGAGLLLGGGGLGIAAALQGEDGYIDAQLDQVSSQGVAVTAEGLELVVEPDTPDWLLRALGVDLRLVVDNGGERATFVGLAPEADLDAYLQGVAHTEVTGTDNTRPILREQDGATQVAAPGTQDFWAVSSSGSGAVTLDWTLEDGRWAVAVMNADGSAGLTTDVEVGVRAGFLVPLAIAFVVGGLIVMAMATTLLVIGATGGSRARGQAAPVAHAPQAGVLGAGMPSGPHPLALTATLDPELSRGLWLVKWFLAIPHFIVLGFLWLAFVLLTLVAGVAILFTGVYPRGIFDFNVGVLRWAWRVGYYATSGGIGTDRYPPFTLSDVPDYPARLDVAYPEHLSRGLVLVKSWLLAIPHLIIVGILVGGSFQWLSDNGSGLRFDMTGGGGVLGLLVLVVGLVLLFTGRYPVAMFDLIVGLNRWVYRVVAYIALMTDTYPPFRLDQGGDEPPSGPPMPPPPSSPPRTVVLEEPSQEVTPR